MNYSLFVGVHNRTESPPEFAPEYGTRQPSVIPEGEWEEDEYITELDKQMLKRYGLESFDSLDSFEFDEEEQTAVCMYVCVYICMYVCGFESLDSLDSFDFDEEEQTAVCMYVCMYICMYVCMWI
jgi:hypothetical protein